jgi:ubiquinone/menaquinone biosynthesis C-methylase UbiE
MRKYQKAKVTRCYDLASAEYSKKFSRELDGKPLDRSLLERIAEALPADARILDFGCGSGQTTRFLYNLGRRGIVGLDLSIKTIEIARSRYKDTSFEVDDILDSKFQDASADGVLAFYAIVHFTYREIEKALGEWRRLLKPGGKLLFCFHVGKKSVDQKDFLGVRGANASWNFFDPDRVIALVSKAGFSLDEALIRFPYEGVEGQSRRCYIFATRAN